MIDYVEHTTSHAKTDTRRFRGIGWGWGEVATSRAFYYYFLVSLSRLATEQSIERGLTLNAPQNVLWW